MEEEKPLVGATALQDQILHGHPVTISQCKFQAHIARISTRADARAIGKAMFTQTAREAGLSGFVCPFAFRLGSVDSKTPESSNRDQVGEEGGTAREARGSINDDNEGYYDNGDVGAGEKLLCLLQKWDVRRRVLVVTRIDGGFVMAELLGVRRYKFVIDRAKRLLDNSDLASLRRAVDTDINATTAAPGAPRAPAETDRPLHKHEAAISGGTRNNTHHTQGGWGGRGARADRITQEDRWDTFVVPLSAGGILPRHTGGGGMTEAPRDSGVDRVASPHNTLKGPSICRVSPKTGTGGFGCGSSREREHRALSLAQLSICSQTVEFSPGHVPCSMGDKGHGKKRGRINHFAVRTPPSTGGDVDLSTCGLDNDSAGSTDLCSGRIATSSRWHLPHELDPTSATTSLLEGGPAGGDGSRARRPGGNRGWGASNATLEPFHDASVDVLGSRVSSCATINSPGRISAIMMGVFSGLSNDHPLHPPPSFAAGCGGNHHYRAGVNRSGGSSSTAVPYPHVGKPAGCTSDGGSHSGSDAPSCNTSAASSARGLGGRHCYNKATLSDVASGKARSDWKGVPPHRPGGGNASATAAAGSANTASSFANGGAAAAAMIRNADSSSASIDHRSSIDHIGSTNRVGDSGGIVIGGIPLPLLRRTPGVGVLGEESRLVQNGDSGGGMAIPRAALGSMSPSVGGWKDDGDRSISTIGDNNPGLLSMEQRTPTPHAPGDDPGLADAGEKERCDSSGIWSLGDPTPRPRVSSGDIPPSRSKSAVRGWSVGRAVPASQPGRNGLNN